MSPFGAGLGSDDDKKLASISLSMIVCSSISEMRSLDQQRVRNKGLATAFPLCRSAMDAFTNIVQAN